MLEKRNPIRRNLTGGLGLGMFAGLLLALPDAVSMLFDFPGAGLWGAVGLLFFFDGVITAGMLGFLRGIVQAAVQKFAGSGAQALAWTLWSRRVLAAVWATAIMPALPLARPNRWLAALALALVASWVAPPVVRFLGAAAEDRRRKGTVLAAAAAAILAGFFCTSHWGAMRLFPAPGFWFLSAFLLHMGALFFLARMIRTNSRYHALWLSPLAGPGVVSIVLLLAMLGGSFARTRLDREDPARIRAASRLAQRLHGGKDDPMTASPAASPDEARPSDPDRPSRVSNPAVPSPPVTVRLDPSRPVLVVTSFTMPAPAFPNGVRVRGGVCAASDPALDLGSFFTGRHLGMWARVAPHWPAPGPAWHQVIASRGHVEVARYGRFDDARGPYFRELPDFGFPEAFEDPEVSPLDAFLRTSDLVSRPFFAWVHLPGDVTDEAVARLSEAAKREGYSVIWLHLPPAAEATVSVLDPGRTAAAADFEAPFAVPGVLPSLLPLTGHRTEFTAAPFPEVHHPRVTVVPWEEPVGAEADVRRLERRIRHAVSRRPGERMPSTPEKLGVHLEKMICSGRYGAGEFKRIFPRVKAFPHRRDLKERLDLLLWRMDESSPPQWAPGLLASLGVRAWRRLAGRAVEDDDAALDPDVLAWTIAIAGGGYSDRLLARCPGAPHTLPSRPR